MGAVAFDTFKFIKTLKKAGLQEPQAEAICIAVRDSHDAAELATKTDLRELEGRLDIKHEAWRHEMDVKHEALRHEMVGMEQRMDAKLEKLGLRLTIWLGGIVFVAVNAGPIISKLLHLF